MTTYGPLVKPPTSPTRWASPTTWVTANPVLNPGTRTSPYSDLHGNTTPATPLGGGDYTAKLRAMIAARRQTSATPSKPIAKPPAQVGQTAQEQWIHALPPEQQAAFAAWVRSQQAASPKGLPPLHLSAAQEGQYRVGRNMANENYEQGLANNQFQRGQASQDFARQLRDLTQQFGDARGHLPDSYVGRGILGSGVFHQALQDLVQKRLRFQGDIQQQQAGAMSAYDLGRTALEQQRDQQLAQIEAQRQAAMAQLAAGSIK